MRESIRLARNKYDSKQYQHLQTYIIKLHRTRDI